MTISAAVMALAGPLKALRGRSRSWLAAELPVLLKLTCGGVALPTAKPAPLAAQPVSKVVVEATLSRSLLASLSLASSAAAGTTMLLERMLLMM
ncbi:hypothetical protein D9M71_684620 [compost metagenome]